MRGNVDSKREKVSVFELVGQDKHWLGRRLKADVSH